ncbi:hypothetical protein KAFR_0B05020 [Kazachstania africana CBS 2517]|uniref:Uncharacterized protein n=1 Tax=Kazachstania africana (strain ATCC 22294 / BCRC 22015 / CBS 2517 / CECT 1963 / NBRC 1671 / NRRL Y-8276) TaxID=1071382 RepID=H2AQZ8_KAZAF|nr:hypothetical protein KAFR_0B05020 [Kazachstania africana CBS 2517]CCF56798.1 hypothetical protein KAFR_0B05020 [Kazachstania africana CBS 2517]
MATLLQAKIKETTSFDNSVHSMKRYTKLKPIHESPNEINSDTSIQEHLLNLTYTSQYSPESTILTTNTIKSDNIISPKKSKLKEIWNNFFANVGNLLENFELKFYENFWLFVLYLNFWFPKLANLITYVGFTHYEVFPLPLY